MTSLVPAFEIPRRFERAKRFDTSMLADSYNCRIEVLAKCTTEERRIAAYFDELLSDRSDGSYDTTNVLVKAKEFFQGLLNKTGLGTQYIVGDWMQYDSNRERFTFHIILRRLSYLCTPKSPRRYTY